MRKITKPILLIVLIILIIIQFFAIDKTNPPVNASQDFVFYTNTPPKVASILKVACYDCHANTTKYPWYTSIQPIAWWIKGHINNGRKHLNYSEWTLYDTKKQRHKIEEMIEVLEDKEMPMLSYMIAHQDAWIDEQQRQLVVEWLKTL